MLLPGHPDARNLYGPASPAAGLMDSFARGVNPPLRFLLACAVRALDQLMSSAPNGKDRRGLCVDQDGLGGLGAAVDP
jgi:hypothetical protein